MGFASREGIRNSRKVDAVHRSICAILMCLSTSGCMVVQLGATNPIPGLTTVVIGPNDLSGSLSFPS